MRKGLGRSLPRNGIHIRAAVAPGASGKRALILDSELDGRKSVLLSVLLCDELIDGRAQINVRADGFLRLNAAECSRTARMIAPRHTGRRHRGCRIESADHSDALLPRFQGLKDERKRGERTFFH